MVSTGSRKELSEMDRQHLVFYTKSLPRSSGPSCVLCPQLCLSHPHPHPAQLSVTFTSVMVHIFFLSTQAKDAYQPSTPNSEKSSFRERDFRALRVTESMTQTEEASSFTALGILPTSLLQAFITKAQEPSQTQPAAPWETLQDQSFYK